MSPKKSPATKPGTFTLSHWYRIVMLPAEIQTAVSALIEYGIDAGKLLKLVAPRTRGRPPSKLKQRKKPGRPSVWTLELYEMLFNLVEEGRRLLQARGAKRITDRAAIDAAVSQAVMRGPIRRGEREGFRNELIKRLPDAKNAIRKPPINSA